MAKMLRQYHNRNQPLVGPEPDVLSLVYFNLVRLRSREEFAQEVSGFETVLVVLSGNCIISVDGREFSDVGRRQDIWSGKADSVYAPSGARVRVVSNADHTEIAIAGGRCDQPFQPFRVLPEEVEMVEVGEATGALPAMLNSVAEFYEEDVQSALAAAMALIEPAILVVMGVVVGFILISLYLPIFSFTAG